LVSLDSHESTRSATDSKVKEGEALMASEFALMKAAQAWQTKGTCDLPMQPALAEAFADIIDCLVVSPRAKRPEESEATQAQLGAPVEDRKVSASDPASASDQMSMASLVHDVEAYRGALGYPVRGDHNGLLSDGTRPVCGICAAWKKLDDELAY
jgi:hypothetical protein